MTQDAVIKPKKPPAFKLSIKLSNYRIQEFRNLCKAIKDPIPSPHPRLGKVKSNFIIATGSRKSYLSVIYKITSYLLYIFIIIISILATQYIQWVHNLRINIFLFQGLFRLLDLKRKAIIDLFEGFFRRESLL